MAQIKNVFISHIHEDDEGLGALKSLLSNSRVELRDSSIHKGKFNNAEDPSYIKSQILGPAIQWAGTFICYVTPGTKASEWVTWEIEYAAKQGKRIVGIWGHGSKDCEVPDALKENADAMVGWHGSSILDAIEGKDGWEKQDGSPGDLVPLKRHPC